MRDLPEELGKTNAPPTSIAASRRSFMQIAAGASALLATGGIALTASRARAATDPDSIVPGNEAIIRRAYALAEVKPAPDLQAWIDAFTPDGTFVDESAGVTYRGKDLAAPVAWMATAFPDIHRELFRVYSVGDMVIVELSINGTNTGPMGSTPPNGRKMRAPCCDVFNLRDGKIVSFHCYPMVLSPSSWTGA